MKYPKPVMTIKELTEMGYPKEWLLSIYRSRSINRDFGIAWKLGGEEKRSSKIMFDTEAFEKYRKAQCTGV